MKENNRKKRIERKESEDVQKVLYEKRYVRALPCEFNPRLKYCARDGNERGMREDERDRCAIALKLRVSELSQENSVLKETVRELNESLKESTRLLLKQTPRPNRPAISADQRMLIAGKARFKCSNPYSDCHLYRLPPYDGSFNESGYELDHITPFSECYLTVGQLQPLCPQCHAKKTRIWRASQNEENACETVNAV